MEAAIEATVKENTRRKKKSVRESVREVWLIDRSSEKVTVSNASGWRTFALLACVSLAHLHTGAFMHGFLLLLFS
jgi:hypothetical protein